PVAARRRRQRVAKGSFDRIRGNRTDRPRLTCSLSVGYNATGCMSTRVQTVADIARLAGVSKSTVSRALNDSPLIGAETKDRIRSIAREHHFQMNVPARSLSLKQSHAIALVTYAHAADSGLGDAFMLELMGGISA